MTLFTTKRLQIKELKERDQDYFIELLSAPEIIDPIPQAKWPLDDILAKFKAFSTYSEDPLLNEMVIWGVYEKNKTELIGLCALLTNDEHQREIGYRFRQKYWGIGYGTEVTKNMIDYCFNQLDLELLTADVYIDNLGSVKILEEFFTPVKEFYNEEDKCMDRRYKLTKAQWQQRD